jgi:hypothetical protein
MSEVSFEISNTYRFTRAPRRELKAYTRESTKTK